jgi:hypothetical protein
MISRKCLSLLTVLFLAGGMSISRAQDNSATNSGSPSDSLGDAARKARAQKKEPIKPAKVFTNDDVGGLRGTISVIGNQPVPADAAKAGPTSPTDKTAGKTPDKKAPSDDSKKQSAKDEPAWRAKFAAARKILAQDTKELDVLQREYNLKLQQYSQDPNWAMHQQNSREDINKTQSDIEAKKQDIDKDKQALADLEDELRKSGGEPGWANEPAGASSSN